MQGNKTLGLTLLVATLSTGGCGTKDRAADTASTVPAAAPTPAPAPAAPALTDPNIVYILDQANAADSARGKLAGTKATNADVKKFGRLMVGEHHALRLLGRQLAKKLKVTPRAPAADKSNAQTKQEMTRLQATKKGAAWDKAYINFEVGYHQAVLETATKALGAAQNAELKNLIEKAAPVIQRHLDMAKQIQSKLK
jgi:putative membrane protein